MLTHFPPHSSCHMLEDWRMPQRGLPLAVATCSLHLALQAMRLSRQRLRRHPRCVAPRPLARPGHGGPDRRCRAPTMMMMMLTVQAT